MTRKGGPKPGTIPTWTKFTNYSGTHELREICHHTIISPEAIIRKTDYSIDSMPGVILTMTEYPVMNAEVETKPKICLRQISAISVINGAGGEDAANSKTKDK